MTTPNTDLMKKIARGIYVSWWVDHMKDPSAAYDHPMNEEAREACESVASDLMSIVNAAVKEGKSAAWDECADRIEIDGGRESVWTDHLREHNPYREEITTKGLPR